MAPSLAHACSLRSRLLTLIFALGLILCGLSSLPGLAHAQSNDDDMPPALAQALEAHGGLDTWRAYGQLAYDFTRTAGDAVLADRQLIDLQARRVRIVSDVYTLVDDGRNVTITPGPDALDYPAPPSFYSQTYFYFFAVPFVLADPGTNYETLPAETLDGTTYDVVKVSYDAGVGDSPDDVYLAYVERETGQLRMLRYSVTFGDINQTEPNSVLVFTDFQEAGELVVPRRGTFHAWTEDGPGEQKAVVTYENVAFGLDRPSDATFELDE